jgi:hypothetical protein
MGQFGFSSVNPRFGTKKSKRHKSTQKIFWAKTKHTCPIILIETPNNEIKSILKNPLPIHVK